MKICRVLKDDQFYFVLTTAIEGIVNSLPGPTAPAGNSQDRGREGQLCPGIQAASPKGKRLESRGRNKARGQEGRLKGEVGSEDPRKTPKCF